MILTISGNIRNTNGDGVARFDRKMLEDLGTATLTTETDWTTGRPTFEGILAKSLLLAVDAKGTAVQATALNDYTADIPIVDFDTYPVMLALKMNGEYLRVRDKGPIWVLYPVEEFPELNTPEYRRRWIWQLNELVIQ